MSSLSTSCCHVDDCKNNNDGAKIYRYIHSVYISCLIKGSREAKVKDVYCHNMKCKMKLFRIRACMSCIYFGCVDKGHMNKHAEEKEHNLSVDIMLGKVYCYKCKDYMYDEEFETISSTCKQIAAKRQGLRYNPHWEPTKEDVQMIKDNGSLVRLHDRTFVGLRGVHNFGFTCFINCVILTLMHTPFLRNYYLSEKHQCKTDSNNSSKNMNAKSKKSESINSNHSTSNKKRSDNVNLYETSSENGISVNTNSYNVNLVQEKSDNANLGYVHMDQVSENENSDNSSEKSSEVCYDTTFGDTSLGMRDHLDCDEVKESANKSSDGENADLYCEDEDFVNTGSVVEDQNKTANEDAAADNVSGVKDKLPICYGCELTNLYEEFYSGKPFPVIPHCLVVKFLINSSNFKFNNPGDSHECFELLISELHEGDCGEKKCNCIIGKVFKSIVQRENLSVTSICEKKDSSMEIEVKTSFILQIVNQEEKIKAHSPSASGGPSVPDGVVPSSDGRDLSINGVRPSNVIRPPSTEAKFPSFEGANPSTNNTKCSVDIKEATCLLQPISLFDCIKRYIDPLPKESECKKCGIEGCLQTITQTRATFLRLPAVFCFNIIRVDGTEEKKMQHHVTFPEFLDMRKLLTTEIECSYPMEEDFRYSLYAVVEHVGHSGGENGHLKVYIRQRPNRWFSITDKEVEPKSFEEIAKRQATLLFYHKHVVEYGRPSLIPTSFVGKPDTKKSSIFS